MAFRVRKWWYGPQYGAPKYFNLYCRTLPTNSWNPPFRVYHSGLRVCGLVFGVHETSCLRPRLWVLGSRVDKLWGGFRV